MFSKTCKYAIRAVLFLALHTKKEKKCSVSDLAEALDVPKHFLAKILQQLSKHGLIASAKGPNGGFYLNEKNLQESLDAIIMCIDGPDFFSGCIMGLPVCSETNPCPLHAQATAYRQGLFYQLRYQSISEMATMIERKELNI